MIFKHRDQQIQVDGKSKLSEHNQLISTWLNQARLVINLPYLDSYEDTLTVIGALSQELRLCYILTSEGQSLTTAQQIEWPKVELICLPQKRFPQHCVNMVNHLIKGKGVEIIHDLFGHLSTACERYTHLPRPFIMVHTQRTTNWGWFSRVRPLGYNIDFHYAGQRTKSLWNDTRIVHAVDHVTVMGPGHEDDLVEGHGIAASKVSFIPSETDCIHFSPSEDVPKVRDNVLLYTGAFVRAKGLDLLFDLFTHLGERDTTLSLSLIGRETPFEKRWFHKRLEGHPLRHRIKVTAFLPRKELVEHYRSAKLYVFPSLFEGSPRSLREAIACGTPAIASDIPGNRGIDPEGRFIWFAPTHDFQAWIKTVEYAMSESHVSYQQRSKEGVKHLVNHHQPTSVATRWKGIYVKVARQKGIISPSLT